MMDIITKDSKEVLPLVGDLTDKVLVMDPDSLAPAFKNRKYQLWRAISGFGCDPGCSGKAIYAVCLSDQEKARWSRSDFIGIYKK